MLSRFETADVREAGPEPVAHLASALDAWGVAPSPRLFANLAGALDSMAATCGQALRALGAAGVLTPGAAESWRVRWEWGELGGRALGAAGGVTPAAGRVVAGALGAGAGGRRWGGVLLRARAC